MLSLSVAGLILTPGLLPGITQAAMTNSLQLTPGAYKVQRDESYTLSSTERELLVRKIDSALNLPPVQHRLEELGLPKEIILQKLYALDDKTLTNTAKIAERAIAEPYFVSMGVGEVIIGLIILFLIFRFGI